MIELDGVTVRRGGRELFHDFSLTLPDPGLYVFAGGNGSGKTLLAQLLTGQLTPQRGRVTVDGSAVYSWLQLTRPPLWYCAAADDIGSAETLENYLSTSLVDTGGNQRELRMLLALVRDTLRLPLEASLGQLAQGEVALAQLALACVLPVRLAVLDGHFGLLDEDASVAAAQLLTEHHAQQESLLCVMATRFGAPLPGALASYRLAGGLPVQVSLADAAGEPTAVHEPGATRRMLRVTLEGGRVAGAAYQSGTTYVVRGLLERGLRVELMGELAAALAEMDASGLRIKAIEWE